MPCTKPAPSRGADPDHRRGDRHPRPSPGQALADHAQGNLRALMIMADELLAAAAEREAGRIDETLFFELYAATPSPAANGRRR
jgi:hypothetical protein